jgi:hypothetical protein
MAPPPTRLEAEAPGAIAFEHHLIAAPFEFLVRVYRDPQMRPVGAVSPAEFSDVAGFGWQVAWRYDGDRPLSQVSVCKGPAARVKCISGYDVLPPGFSAVWRGGFLLDARSRAADSLFLVQGEGSEYGFRLSLPSAPLTDKALPSISAVSFVMAGSA